MTKYSHLGQEQRYQIEALKKVGKTQTEIAQAIGCHKSSICRELKRNGSRYMQYYAARAQEKTEERHRKKNKRIRFSARMRDQIVRWLSIEKFSPELICEMGRRTDPSFVSHETIYQFIWQSRYDYRRESKGYRRLYLLLKHGQRRRKRGNYRDARGLIPTRVSIEKRPAIVRKRNRLGDLEVDLLLGLNSQPGLIVILDRASLKTTLIRIRTRDPRKVARQIIERMKRCDWIKTMTYDNDISFRHHQRVNEALQVQSFFTHPYTSQEKGSVENRIGILRRFFPKKTDFTAITSQQVKSVEKLINERPIRKFSYRSANEVFNQKSRI